ncbi:MAG: outer membrane lipoprotein-sorting protein [bacterium]
MRNLLLYFVFLGFLVAPIRGWATEPPLTGEEIVNKAVDRNAMGFQAGQAQLTLLVEDSKKERRERRLDVKSKKIGGLANTLVTLLAPAEVQGQAFLFAERAGEDDVWMYLPSFKVTRRIEGGQKNGAFLGSHFTYADLESRALKDGEYKRLPDEKIGKTDVYVVETTPKKGAKSDYSKVTVWVRKSDFIPMRVRFFGDADKVIKTLFIEKLDKTTAGQTYAKQLTLRAEGGGFTTMTIDALSESELDDGLFSKDQLGK